MQTFDVDLPPNWRSSERLALNFRGLKVPANRSGELQVTALDPQGRESLVGVLPFIGLARDAQGSVARESAVLLVPRAVRLANAVGEGERQLRIRVRPVDGAGKPMEDLTWEVREIVLEVRPR